jgi:pilus assembly protein CpaE
MRIFLASDDPGISYQLREQLLGLGQDCPASQVVSLDHAVPLLSSLAGAASATTPAAGERPRGWTSAELDLVFVVLPPAVDRSLDVVRDIRRRAQPLHLFVVGPTTDSKIVLRAMREGAHEYLDQADLAQELSAAIERLKVKDSGRPRAKTTALLSPSGGTGCSTLAVNLAAVLAQQQGGCILLDLETEFGDLASLLDLKPVHTSADLCRNAAHIDRNVFEKSLVRHGSGLMLLAAPAQISDAAHVTWEGIRQVLALASDLASHVVADLSHSFLETMAPVLAHADHILLVLRLDFTSLRNTRRVLEHLEQSGIPRDRIRVVANRYRRPGELTVSEAQTALGFQMAHYVLDDPKNVNRANNQGMPVVQYAPSAKVSRQLTELALSLVPEKHPSN